ncbi:ankyrin repeat domain-containing protein [uncultured Porphyromonas sp.]|uniref:ankyrin repeat domain-containing protein n=1 Tax=uncultured Porphyromonas sp. TaxID=159274 RepID=UPI0025CE4481|nr:ankyrin repeat domain-containing protein [uncultured Porphyromonas sp.]
MSKRIKKYPNFQDLYSFEDYKRACEAQETFCCGLSPICLSAPKHHVSVHTDVTGDESSDTALVTIRTLKLAYATQVWTRAMLVSSGDDDALYGYWSLHYRDNETSFRELAYVDLPDGVTPEVLASYFWDLLETIANSGSVKVCEGYSLINKGLDGLGITESPLIAFDVVLDRDEAKGCVDEISDVMGYPYNREPRSYRWEEIRDLFTELSLKQLSLMNLELLHKHTDIDEDLFRACNALDIQGVKFAISRGANVNALDKKGESALQKAVEDFSFYGIEIDKRYSDEERTRITDAAYERSCAIVDLLVSHGADVDLFGVEGRQPITCAYFEHSPTMIKHLLELGSDPNYNSYRSDDVPYESEDSTRCTILNFISEDWGESYGAHKDDKEMAEMIRAYGGRLYDWDYDPQRRIHIGRYYVRMEPDEDEENLFFDNSGWGIGDADHLTIEDETLHQTTISLEAIKGLRQWHAEYRRCCEEEDFDRDGWNRRGLALAREVARVLPESVALHYPYGDELEIQWFPWCKRHHIMYLSESRRITPTE